MQLNEIGKIMEEEWQQTEKIRRNVKLDAFVVMPNHLHGILVIDNLGIETPVRNNVETPRRLNVETPRPMDAEPHHHVETNCILNVETPRRGVSTAGFTADGISNAEKQIRNPNHKPEWKPGSVGAIINQFKSICTKRIHQIHPALDRVWQPRFHDRIIRNEDELNRVRDYIWQNPENWGKDEENQERF